MVRRQLSSDSHFSGNSTSSSHSHASDHSHSTAPSVYSQMSLMKYSQDRPATHNDPPGREGGSPWSSLSSVGTYTSTLPSEEDLTYQQPFDAPASGYDVYASDATPSNPAEFAVLFPSHRTLLIHHDNATSDGNMNLRIDTYVHGADGYRQKLTLFHLRMHDLKERRFSLRRYCRESGREVCSSNRKYASTTSPVSARSTIQQSLGTAFQQLRLTHEEPVSAQKHGVRRDMAHEPSEDQYYPRAARPCHSSREPPSPTNTIQLDREARLEETRARILGDEVHLETPGVPRWRL